VLLLPALIFITASVARSQAPAATSNQLEELLTPKLYRDYNRQSNYKDRLDVIKQGLEKCMSDLKDHLKKMDTEVVLENLRKMSALALYAQDEPSRRSASPKDLRSKQVKKAEIRIREIVSTLRDYRLSVPFEYRGQFDAAMAALEELRDQLLVQLFGKAAASPRPPG
jgi:hypothetical protein